MSDELKAPDLEAVLTHAERAIHHRKNTNHVYTRSRTLDTEIYTWFRGRWPNLNVLSGTDNERSQLRDRGWWDTFIHHFQSRVPGLHDMCLLQLDTGRLLLKNNVELVMRAVWLCIEITRHREML
jgi:hypothetical protein